MTHAELVRLAWDVVIGIVVMVPACWVGAGLVWWLTSPRKRR